MPIYQSTQQNQSVAYGPPVQKLTKQQIAAREAGGALPMSSVTNPNAANNPYQAFTPNPPSVLGTGTTNNTSSYNSGQYAGWDPIAAQADWAAKGFQNIQQGQDAGNSQIDADYEYAMNELGSQESGLRGQAGSAEAQITNDAAAAKTDLARNQGVQEQGVNTSLQTAEKQGTSAMQQARDLFRQTQQSNIAQLSAMGISSSSVSEALAERLGVETARRIAGVTGSIQEVRQNAVNELGRIKTYFSDKTTQLEENVRIQKDQIQQALMQGLNQINSARQMASSAKASARANLLSQVQSQIGALTQQHQQFQQSLDQWAQQKSASLTPIAQDQNYVQNLIAQTQNLNQQFAPTGFVATPSFSVDKQGSYTGQINFNKKPTDELENPFAQPGV